MPKRHYISKTHNQKGQKHTGIYGNGKDIQPIPKSSYVNAKFALPVGYVLSLQERYPGLSLAMAIKHYLLENIQPVKEI